MNERGVGFILDKDKRKVRFGTTGNCQGSGETERETIQYSNQTFICTYIRKQRRSFITYKYIVET